MSKSLIQPAHQTVYQWVKEPAEMKLVLCAARSSPVRATVPTVLVVLLLVLLVLPVLVLLQALITVSGLSLKT